MIWFIYKSIAYGSNHYLFMAIVYIEYRSLFYKQYSDDNNMSKF